MPCGIDAPGYSRVEGASHFLGLIRFCVSPPRPGSAVEGCNQGLQGL